MHLTLRWRAMHSSRQFEFGHGMYRQQIQQLIDRVEILDYNQVLLDGSHLQFSNHVPDGGHLAVSLGLTLYSECYTKLSATQDRRVPARRDGVGLLNELIQANPNHGHAESGWRVESKTLDGQFIVSHRNERMQLDKSVCFSIDTSGGSAGDDEFCVHFPGGAVGLQRGYYYAYGQRPVGDGPGCVRAYLNADFYNAVDLLSALVSALNHYRISFSLKLPDHPRRYMRPDSVVLYFGRRHLSLVRDILIDVAGSLVPPLRHEVPLFTFHLIDGIGLAMDPGAGESFGMSRCQLVAEGLVVSFETDRTDRLSAEANIARAFERSGLSLSRPYLSPDGDDPFDFCPDP
jgi:hypothetical protein